MRSNVHGEFELFLCNNLVLLRRELVDILQVGTISMIMDHGRFLQLD